MGNAIATDRNPAATGCNRVGGEYAMTLGGRAMI